MFVRDERLLCGGTGGGVGGGQLVEEAVEGGRVAWGQRKEHASDDDDVDGDAGAAAHGWGGEGAQLE